MRNSVHILGRTEPKYCNYEGREEWIRKEKYYYYILIKSDKNIVVVLSMPT